MLSKFNKELYLEYSGINTDCLRIYASEQNKFKKTKRSTESRSRLEVHDLPPYKYT